MRKIVSSILLIAIFTNVFAAPVAAHWRDWDHDWPAWSSDRDWNWRDRKPEPKPAPTPAPVTPKPTPQPVQTPAPVVVPDPIIYGFEVQKLALPASLGVNRHYFVPLTIKNTSSFEWRRNRTIISYRWIDSNGQYEVYRGKSTLLVKSIDPNELSHSKQRLHIKAPEIPGTYMLAVDVWNNGKWITTMSSSKYEVNLNVLGKVWVLDYKPLGKINDDAQYATSPDLSIKFNRNLYFVYMWYALSAARQTSIIKGFAQATSATKEEIQNGTAKWSTWQPLTIEDKTVKVAYTLENQNVGNKRVYVRFRALPRNKNITTDEYAQSMIRYGSAERTSPAFYVDEIFFDNQPPTGGVQINNNAYSTSSRTGNLHIWADDGTGSGIDAMRWTANCNMADLNANSWSEWETNVGDRYGVNLGGGNLMSICVQIRDKAGLISTFRDEIWFIQVRPSGGSGNTGGITIGHGIGTPENPYADKSFQDMGTPSIEFDRFIGLLGTNKWNVVKTYNIPAPQITYVERVDKNTVKVFGVGIKKYNPANIIVNNQYLDCAVCGGRWEKKEEMRTIDNVKLVLYKQTGAQIAELWNDDPNGQWNITLKLDANLTENDSVYAQIYVYHEYYFDGLKWWTDTTENRIKFEAWNLTSGKSETLQIPLFTQLLVKQVEEAFHVEVEDGNARWSSEELEWVIQALNSVPRQIWDHDRITSITRQAWATPSDVYCNGGTEVVPNIVGCFEPLTDTLYMYNGYRTGQSLGYLATTSEQEFKITLLHEFAHGYQALRTDIQDRFDNISWETVDKRLSDTKECDFVDEYAGTHAFEDFAETYGVFYVRPDAFKYRIENDSTCTGINWDSSDLNAKFSFNKVQ